MQCNIQSKRYTLTTYKRYTCRCTPYSTLYNTTSSVSRIDGLLTHFAELLFVVGVRWDNTLQRVLAGERLDCGQVGRQLNQIRPVLLFRVAEVDKTNFALTEPKTQMAY